MPSPSAAAPVELEEEVVSASAFEEDRDKSPGSVTVIHADEMKGEMRSLPELLERAPGLHVIRARGRGAYTVTSIRGSTSAQVAVYLDGVLQNLGSEAAVDLSAVPAAEVSRIEVYKGYIPSRFPEAGMGGVVNIVTRAPEAKKRTTLTLGVESFGAKEGRIAQSGPLGRGKYLASAGYRGSDGNFPYRNDNGTPYNEKDDYDAKRSGNGYGMTDLLFKWEDDHWDGRFSWSRQDRDLPSPAPGMDKSNSPRGARLDTDKWDLSLSRRQKWGAVLWGWRLEYLAQNRVWDNPDNILGGMGERHNEYRAKRFSGSLDASWTWGTRHFFEATVSGSNESLDVEGDVVTVFQGRRSFDRATWKAVLQDSISLTPDGSLLLTPSFRWDAAGNEGKTAWSVAAAKQIGSEWILRAGYGSYSRAPNLYERYGDGATIRPNDKLKWETGTQWDFGVSWNNLKRERKNADVALMLTAFGRETEELIEFIMASPRYGVYENIARARVYGLELEGSIDSPLWKLAFSGTWMRAKNETPDNFREGRRLPNAPEWTWSVRLTRRFPDRKGNVRLWAFVEGQFTGDNYFDQAGTVRYDDLFLLNMGMKWRIQEDMELAFGVRDVLDNGPDVKLKAVGGGLDRMSWYPLPGRSFYASLSRVF